MSTTLTPMQIYKARYQKHKNGIKGYYVMNKYHDPAKMKFERMLYESKKKYQGPKQLNVSKKITYIQEHQNKQKALGRPSPTTYHIQKINNKAVTVDVIKHPRRKTFADQFQIYLKKNPVPGSNVYQNKDDWKNMKKSKSKLSRYQNPCFVDVCMKSSSQCPGVGVYNLRKHDYDHRMGKWVADPQYDQKSHTEKKKKSQEKLPFVGTYDPNPVTYRLFSSMSQKQKLRNNSGLSGKAVRFKYDSKDKKLPFYYNISSEWGMKDKLRKKDIMSNISTHRDIDVHHHSVYY